MGEWRIENKDELNSFLTEVQRKLLEGIVLMHNWQSLSLKEIEDYQKAQARP